VSIAPGITVHLFVMDGWRYQFGHRRHGHRAVDAAPGIRSVVMFIPRRVFLIEGGQASSGRAAYFNVLSTRFR
jgi:hypothetical protein